MYVCMYVSLTQMVTYHCKAGLQGVETTYGISTPVDFSFVIFPRTTKE